MASMMNGSLSPPIEGHSAEMALAAAGGRRLIVNADDFGLTSQINRGIVEACRDGIVTSASLMVRWSAAAEAVALGRELAADSRRIGLGLHVDLGEWAWQSGRWVALYEVVDLDDRPAIEHEAARQLAQFESLTGTTPTHIDSHQHVHRQEPVRSVLLAMADRLGVPLRHFSPLLRYCGEFYGQTHHGLPQHAAIGTAALIDILNRLPAGITELACHPGYPGDEVTMYRQERAEEVRILCDPAIRRAIEEYGIRLASFADVRQQSQPLEAVV